MKEKIQEYIKKWEQRCYFEGIPDEVPSDIESMDNVPSYKKIAKAILNNNLKILGINGKTSKYYSIYKQIELQQKYKSRQLKLDL